MEFLNTRKLFLIDGLGAMISAFCLGMILVKYEYIFGIPKNTLYILASIPCLFATYDFICYWKTEENANTFLKYIAFANIIYCLISIGMGFYHYSEIKLPGWIYLLSEISIILILVYFELKTASSDRSSS